MRYIRKQLSAELFNLPELACRIIKRIAELLYLSISFSGKFGIKLSSGKFKRRIIKLNKCILVSFYMLAEILLQSQLLV